MKEASPQGIRKFWLLALFAVLAPVGVVPEAGADDSDQTALDRYIAKPDPSYSFQVVKTIPGEGYKLFIIDMKSQTWRSPDEVNRTLWQHWLLVVKPDVVATNKGLLFIGGGSNKDATPPAGIDPSSIAMAKELKAVVAELKQVPNQPLIFAGETRGRSEDALIAYTWKKFMETGDEMWPARLPMVKSAVRALDTIQTFLKSEEGGKVDVDEFVVSGGSKRGWTTWLTAAVDKRVVSIVPIVIDVLNVDVSMEHHRDAYGFWAPAIGDYTREKIQDTRGLEMHDALMKIEDPYSYRHRFTMPKLIINSTGDQFFCPDSSQFYFPDLPGEKALRYVPNTKHSLEGSDARQTLYAWFHSIIAGSARPKFSWTKEADGSLVVKTTDKPKEVNLWQATNPTARDFRLDRIGKAYASSPLVDQGGGVYIGKVEKPAAGWTAFMVELVFDSGCKYPLKLTTEVSVVPDTLPGKEKAALQGK